ncbi:LCP family protein [Nocardiopsis flavescens]|uniref:Cell envelope-related function transcriptional attenuator common domain-containing protein n=1 Tax=Nocardiopsis flavescens TaxID=758803 RepID=A0A1M6FZH4_9ACTN|nr:LCP family protein [Nocardiopsis flavescens]SHJ03060.1 cell envelope-related function transcriptional attenuator common domain-containing protein [Nocardiopsis flavescens]
MADRGRRGGSDPTGEHDRQGVFRRKGADDGPEAFEKLYRARESEQRVVGESRRIPDADEVPPLRRERPQRRTHHAGREYDGTGRNRRRRRRQARNARNVTVVALVVLLFVVLVVPAWFYLWSNARLQRVDALQDYEGRPDRQDGDVFMIVGSDSRDGLDDDQIQELATGRAEGRRTDTIMLLYIPDTDEAEPTIVSVPRDSYVPLAIPGFAANKINASFADAVCGTDDEGEEVCGGPAPLVQTFEQASGVRVDHYVEIGMGGFVGLVDAVGGVELCPEEPMEDPKAGLDIEAGCQTMDGGTALGYVRTRATPRADLDRIARQREFFSALVEEASAPGTLFNPFQSVPLVLEGTDMFVVDEGDKLRHLATMLLAMRGGTQTTAIPVGATPTLPDVGSVVQWDEARSEEMFAAMREGEPIPESAFQD